jgi:hypothetical protein
VNIRHERKTKPTLAEPKSKIAETISEQRKKPPPNQENKIEIKTNFNCCPEVKTVEMLILNLKYY